MVDGMITGSSPVKYLMYSASYLLFAATMLRGSAAIFLRFSFHSVHADGEWRPISYRVDAMTNFCGRSSMNSSHIADG